MKFVLVGLYCGPLLTLIPPLTRTLVKKRGSGIRASGNRVMRGLGVCMLSLQQY